MRFKMQNDSLVKAEAQSFIIFKAEFCFHMETKNYNERYLGQ